MNSSSSSSSLKEKLKQTLCFSCCFRRQTLPESPPSLSSSSSNSSAATNLVRSSSAWIRTDRFPEIKDKCRNFFSGGRSSVHHHHHHRGSSSTDFKYDPLSYSLNFEDGYELDDEAPLRGFSSRLPSSPPMRSVPEQSVSVL